MDPVVAKSCLCCGQQTKDYLAHLIDEHKFSLVRAREVIAEKLRPDVKRSGAAAAHAEPHGATDRQVGLAANEINVGGVPIKLPGGGGEGSSGPPIHIHLNFSAFGGAAANTGMLGVPNGGMGGPATAGMAAAGSSGVAVAAAVPPTPPVLEAAPARPVPPPPPPVPSSPPRTRRRSAATAALSQPTAVTTGRDARASGITTRSSSNPKRARNSTPTAPRTLTVIPIDASVPVSKKTVNNNNSSSSSDFHGYAGGGEDSDSDIEIVDEIVVNKNNEAPIVPNLSNVKKEKEEGEKAVSKRKRPAAFGAKRVEEKDGRSKDGVRNKKIKELHTSESRITLAKQNNSKVAGDDPADMFRYGKLDELVSGGDGKSTVQCRICSKKIQRSKHAIQEHVLNIHGINAVQYHALYFEKAVWSQGCLYACRECGVFTNSQDTIGRHMRMPEHKAKADPEYKWEQVLTSTLNCPWCDKEVWHAYLQLRKHVIGVHKFEMDNFLALTKKRFNDNCKTIVEKEKENKGPVQAVPAKKIRDSAPVAQLNYRDRPCVCPRCDLEFQGTKRLGVHLRKAHNMIDIKGDERLAHLSNNFNKYSACRLCDKTMVNTEGAINLHLTQKHGTTLPEYLKRFGLADKDDGTTASSPPNNFESIFSDDDGDNANNNGGGGKDAPVDSNKDAAPGGKEAPLNSRETAVNNDDEDIVEVVEKLEDSGRTVEVQIDSIRPVSPTEFSGMN